MNGVNVKLFLFVCFVFSCACTRRSAYDVFETLTDSCDVIEAEDKTFVLDDETTQNTDCLQCKDSLLIFGNKYDNSLVFYNLHTGDFERKIKFDVEGGNGVGKSIFAYYRNQDSVFVWNYQQNTLYMLDGDAKVQWKYAVSPSHVLSGDSIFLPPQVLPRTNNPMVQIGNDLLLSGAFFGEVEGENSFNRPVLVWFDLQNQKISYSDSYPDIYHTGYWGGDFTYRFPYYTVNMAQEVVLSFAADPKIRVRKRNEISESKIYYAGIGKGEEIIPPVDGSINTNAMDNHDLFLHFAQNLNYSCIHYDRWKNVYYRLVQLPCRSDINVNAPIIRKPLAIIVLDNNFRIISRRMLPKYDYLINQCFVSEDGFHIQVRSIDDDIMRFKTFKLCLK